MILWNFNQKKYMLLRQFLFSILLLLLFDQSIAQHNGNKFSVLIGIDYTTTAQIFLNPNSSDIVLRNKSFEIEHITSPMLDLRYRLTDDIILGISSEYISKSKMGRNFSALEGSQVVELVVEDGVEFIPIELSVYYYMPFSTEDFKFTMGAGGGYYIGKQTRIFGDTEIERLESEYNFSLLVSVGMEYLFLKNISLRFDMKFRDPELKLKSRYLKDQIIYEGTTINLSNDEFYSKINLNGISFLLGLAFQF